MESHASATGQAVCVVVLSSVAAGIRSIQALILGLVMAFTGVPREGASP